MLNVRFELEPPGSSPRAGRGGAVLAAGLVAAIGFALLIDSVATGADSRIHACVGKKSGTVRIVAAGKRCKKGERRVTWKRVGPVGAVGSSGSDGATGPQGATGTTGAPGVDDFNDLEGLPCTRDNQQGTVDLAFGPGGLARPRCQLPGQGPVCGDGVAESGEACDDGNTNPTDSCTNQCQLPVCGDSVVQPGEGEQCDAAGNATAMCDANCTAAYCGDGVLNSAAGEACDTAGDSQTCDIDCTPPSCGDGRVNTVAGEACDDGNMATGDGCNACQLEP
jgi:cysteine-rich repeat protein